MQVLIFSINLLLCRRRGISVTNVGDVFLDDVADAAIGLFIDVMRRITAGDRFVRRRSWPVSGEYSLGFKVFICCSVVILLNHHC